MIYCKHCNLEVSQEDEKGYEITINRWTMDFPKISDCFYFHKSCWDKKLKNNSSMEDLFGEFIEPKKATSAKK